MRRIAPDCSAPDCGRRDRRARISGFSLIELMVAITLGLLLSIGIVTLFGATSKTNKVQDALARLQENGRYAVTRMTDDLRMTGGQYCGNASNQGWTTSPNDGPLYPGMSILVNATGVSNGANGALPDSGGLLGVVPTPAPPNGVYPLGPADFTRGYDCAPGGGCNPGVPSGAAPDGLPAEGEGDGLRVRGADVLTIRYQRGTGWNFAVGAGTPPPLALTQTVIAGQPADDPLNFVSGDRAVLVTCGGGQIVQVNAAGNAQAQTLTPFGLLNNASYNPANVVGSFDVRAFNFSRDFITVTYYLAYKNDPDTPGRLIPVLYRRANGTQTDELVQGVERLDFIYGVQYADASLHYLNAEEVTNNSAAAGNCSPASPGLGLAAGTTEPNCLWRSIRSIEVHMLLDTIDDIALSGADMAYRYTIDGPDMTVPPAADQDMGNGMLAGRMMRREFVALVATRNGNH
jgi:type IV pilus assembly protein PilW